MNNDTIAPTGTIRSPNPAAIHSISDIPSSADPLSTVGMSAMAMTSHIPPAPNMNNMHMPSPVRGLHEYQSANGAQYGSDVGGSRTGPEQQSMGGVGSTLNTPRTPSSAGLIRLSLKKPMGIVFEPMYDPNQPSVQRGVRICDLPRTGAAALSRQLQVGDELLQINDTTVSRLTFDEIMDFIIEADPEAVHLLFRRPRKEMLQLRQGVPQKLQAAANKDAPSTVKWVDETGNVPGGANHTSTENNAATSSTGPQQKVTTDDKRKSTTSRGRKKKRSGTTKRPKKGSVTDEDETLQSSTVEDEESFVKTTEKIETKVQRNKKLKSRRPVDKKKPNAPAYESESFLDLLIDTLCSNTTAVCRGGADGNVGEEEEEEASDDDVTFGSDGEDESTYVTYEESLDQNNQSKGRATGKGRASANGAKAVENAGNKSPDEERYMDPDGAPLNVRRKNDSHQGTNKQLLKTGRDAQPHSKVQTSGQLVNGKYVDDATLETTESVDVIRPILIESSKNTTSAPHQGQVSAPSAIGPLGLTPVTPGVATGGIVHPPPPPPGAATLDDEIDDGANPAPIRELEYDDRIDHGADVSVMESLGGPSLLIEKQRAAQQLQPPAPTRPVVPADIVERFGLDYPADFGRSRLDTILNDPLRFYTYVVRSLLDAHEPEKVRLLDKLLAKYVGREDHLVRKLAVRYRSDGDNIIHNQDFGDDGESFTDAVRKNKSSLVAENAVKSAQERMQMVLEGVEYHDENYNRPQHRQVQSKINRPTSYDWPDKEQKEPDIGDEVDEDDEEQVSGTESDYSQDSVDGTSPVVIAQVSDLLNCVYGKTTVRKQIERVSAIMRAYEGREALLLQLLETKALIYAHENGSVEELPPYLRTSQLASRNIDELGANLTNTHIKDLPPVTPMAGGPQGGASGIADDISSMSGVSSPAAGGGHGDRAVAMTNKDGGEEVEVKHFPVRKQDPMANFASVKAASSSGNSSSTKLFTSTTIDTPSARTITTVKTPGGTYVGKPPTSTTSLPRKKKGLFGSLFGGRNKAKENGTAPVASNIVTTPGRNGSRSKGRRVSQ
jgi:hypothetical protein